MICTDTTTLTGPDEAQSDHGVAFESEAKHEEPCLNQRRFPQAEIHACERSSSGRTPSIPKTGVTKKKRPPESFDALAARLNEWSGKLAAEVEQMRKELGAAEERSERLQHKLLANGTLRGRPGGRPTRSAAAG
jgi:hypothetical protein